MQWRAVLVAALVAVARSSVSALEHTYTLPVSIPAGPAQVLDVPHKPNSSVITTQATVTATPVFEARLDGIFMNGAPFTFKGANYFGFETDILVPHGLWGGKDSTTLQKVATTLRANQFNAVRLPFAVSAVLGNVAVDAKNVVNEVALTSAFQGQPLKYLDVLDYAIRVFGDNKILVLLEAHFLDHTKGGIGEVWYTSDADKDNFENAWKLLAARYKDTYNVVGADLKNEPHGKATWGSGDVKTDWRLASLKWATSILEINPRWLIFVEGTERSSRDDLLKPAPWGGNLMDLQRANLTLPIANRLVYSPHAYGPDVLPLMPYFWAFWAYPGNLPAIWDLHFGFAQGKYGPFVVGEWGGKYKSDADKKWQDKFAAYLKERNLGWFYWCFNPNGGDTEGLVENDWNTPRADKLKLLSVFQGTPIP